MGFDSTPEVDFGSSGGLFSVYCLTYLSNKLSGVFLECRENLGTKFASISIEISVRIFNLPFI
jgi:hypothetical protein